MSRKSAQEMSRTKLTKLIVTAVLAISLTRASEVPDAEQFEIDCGSRDLKSQAFDDDEVDNWRCRQDFLDRRQVMLKLSGAPTDYGRDGKNKDLYEEVTADQYFHCTKEKLQYMWVKANFSAFFARTMPDDPVHQTWKELPDHVQSMTERFAICVPRSCSVQTATTQVFPFHFFLLMTSTLHLSHEQVQALPPLDPDELELKPFMNENTGTQAMWDKLFEDFHLLRATLDPPDKFESHLDIGPCINDFNKHTEILHAWSSLGIGGARAGPDCLERGQQLLRVEVSDWCALPAGLRGKVRASMSMLVNSSWVDAGAPFHICVPAECGATSLRGALLPDYLYRVIGGNFASAGNPLLHAAAETDFFRSPNAFQIHELTDWSQVALTVALVGFPGEPFEDMKEALRHASVAIFGVDSTAHRAVSQVAELDGEEMPWKSNAKEFKEDGEQQLQHVLRFLRCDAKKSLPEERAECLARNEMQSVPLPLALERHRALVCDDIAHDMVLMRRLARIPNLKIIVAPPLWGHMQLDTALEFHQLAALEEVRAAVPHDRLHVIHGGDAAEGVAAALRFASVVADPLITPKVSKGPIRQLEARSKAAIQCKVDCRRHWKQLWSTSGASLASDSLNRGLAAALLSNGEQVWDHQVACTSAGHEYWELRLSRSSLRSLRHSCLGWHAPPLTRKDRLHLSGIGVCLPSSCQPSSARLALPLWLSRWMEFADQGSKARRPTPHSPTGPVRWCAPPRASEMRLLPFSAVERLGPVPWRAWPASFRKATCVPGSRRRRGSPQVPKYSGCSCEAQPIPCIDADLCAGLARTSTNRKKERLALVTVHDLQIPFEEADDRKFRRYLRPAHKLFYEQESLKAIRRFHNLEHVLIVPEAKLAKYPLRPQSREDMRKHDVRIIEVPWLHPPLTATVVNETISDHQTFGPAEFIRLHLWNLTDYDAVMYIDHDMTLLGDITPMLMCSRATGLYLTTSGNTSPLNFGLHALRPDARIFASMVDVLAQTDYWPDLGFTSSHQRTWGIVDGMGQIRGSAHAGMQGFLYYFFYSADQAVRRALRRHGVARTLAAQIDRCLWNYSKDHLMYKYFVDEPVKGGAAALNDQESLLFRCRLGALGRPRILHKIDEAMLNFLIRNVSVSSSKISDFDY